MVKLVAQCVLGVGPNGQSQSWGGPLKGVSLIQFIISCSLVFCLHISLCERVRSCHVGARYWELKLGPLGEQIVLLTLKAMPCSYL